MTIRLDSLDHCFQGIVPGAIATCSRDGTPNISYLSHVCYVDAKHVALSCQFFNKTRQNLDENPHACVQVYDPVSFECYLMRLRFLRSESSGPLFDSMSLRIQAIASHTGMTGVFRLLSADVFQVRSVERVEGFLQPLSPEDEAVPPFSPSSDAVVTELSGLQLVSLRINRAVDLAGLLRDTLVALDEVFGFHHGMLLLPDESGTRLVALASRGYGEEGIGAEVRLGDGLIGMVAAERKLLRFAGLGADLRYGRAIRARVNELSGPDALAPEIPLPGLPDASSQLAIPLLMCDRLVGVLALESRDSAVFARWHEAFLQVLANQIAVCIERMMQRDDEEEAPPPAASRPAPAVGSRRRTFCLYRNDDCVFVDGEYLIRNVPGKILWKMLRAHQQEGRTDFCNRELRLDPSLGLPPIKDNLESRLILLRKRLEQKCPDLRIVPTGRGRFAFEVSCQLELVERDSA
ncbi:MAG TPA: GAF domain-containing protein [Kofleriaceae bacterium]|nr:GAF domain-containing protein [Kofleriaceae bacterium]